MDRNKGNSNLENRIFLFQKSGSQTSEWKYAVSEAIKCDKVAKNDTVRKNRVECSDKRWDGKTTDESFQRKKIVNRP